MGSFSSLQRLQYLTALWLALFLIPVAAHAQSPLHAVLDNYVRTQTQGLPGKVTYTIGQLDARTQLSPCESFEPFLPAGSRLWGKGTVGVRCLGPSSWTVYIPVQVNVSGNYLISARAMAAGHIVGVEDVTVRSGDLSTLPTTAITDQTFAIGKTVKFGMAAGQPLRSDQLIAPWAVQQGHTVKTISKGSGFSVSSEGVALSNAVAGQSVQIRTPSGQTIRGVAQSGGVVEISY